jgi:hypothetical protein
MTAPIPKPVILKLVLAVFQSKALQNCAFKVAISKFDILKSPR